MTKSMEVKNAIALSSFFTYEKSLNSHDIPEDNAVLENFIKLALGRKEIR